MFLSPALLIYPLTLVLLVLAGLHIYWGLGGFWPGHDEASLVEHVVGRTADMKAPPFWACMIVAGCLVSVLVLVGGKRGVITVPDLMSWVRYLGLYAAASVFFMRGLAAYIPKIFDYAKGTPFYDLNLVFYSPLCLCIGAALIALNVMRT